MKSLGTLLAVAFTAVLVAPAGAQVPEPDADPFYAVPAGIGALPDGTVLDARAVTATALSIPLPASAWQVKYKTRDNQDRATATVTTVMVPRAPWRGSGPRPVVSYQTAEDGVGTKCAPSYALRAGLQAGASNSEGETTAIAAALAQGWTVVAPDYEGPTSQFAGVPAEAHGILDGIRAARAFAPAGIAAGAPIGVWGYSGGALASASAAQLQATYAPELHLAGIALGGVVPDLKATFKAFDTGPLAGAIVIGIIGLDRSYPDAHLLDYLNDAGRQAVAASQKDCIADAVGRHFGKHADDLSARPDIIDDPGLTAFLARVSPLGVPGVPTAPVYDYHAVGDELAPIDPDRRLVARYCGDGATVDHVEDQVGEHFSELGLGAPGAVAFLGDRFAGKAATSTCPPAPATAAAVAAHAVRVGYALRVSPGVVRHGRRARVAFLARRRAGEHTTRLAGATIRFAGHGLRTDRHGRATLRLALPRGTARARLIVAGRTVATATVVAR